MIRTVLLDSSRCATPRELHRQLASLLSLPDWYGCNADALNDCLSASRDTVHLWITSRGEGETARALDLICQVVEDNGGTVRELGI